MTGVKDHALLLQSEDPSARQREAAGPDASVWVAASAGTGKTKVLTDRVLRLLLPRDDGTPGTPPHRILCLTFTKAAASEMALRISRTLAKWSTASEQDLADRMRDLFGRDATLPERDAARRLFASVVDTPGGLKIMTIHSFCTSLLGRFPLEAGLPPHFKGIEEQEAQELLFSARDTILERAQARPDTPEGRALTRLSAEQAEDRFNMLLKALTSERHQLQALLADRSTEEFRALLCRTLGICLDDDDETTSASFCCDDNFNAADLWECCRHLASGTETEQKTGRAMQAWLEQSEQGRADNLATWRKIFLTDGNIRARFLNKKTLEAFPNGDAVMRAEAERLIALTEKLKAIRAARLTLDIVIIGKAIVESYQALKKRRAVLDFDDLIHTARALLTQSGMAAWVLYKMDGGIDHILIDEAQDTNPEQWEIVEALSAEFFAGEGVRADIRTVFTVGDEKQSIFSFQRARPEKFAEKRSAFRDKVEAARRDWREIPLNTSFRSAPAILDFVDTIFAPETARSGLGSEPIRHISYRHGHDGRVELWPLIHAEGREQGDFWSPPLTVIAGGNAQAALAERIARQISDWIASGEILPSRDRPIGAGDILILVRKRTALVNHVIRALKKYGIPVSGVDRLVIKDQLGVQDLMAVAQAALLPEDDLTLACMLKGPFLGWDDSRLEALAFQRRPGQTLWDTLRDTDAHDTLRWIRDQIHFAGLEAPYEFFSRVLQSPCPADPISGLHAVTARLGEESLDAITEFINQALGFEANHISALQLFLIWQQQGDTDIKRQQEEAGGKVRIMTVHASKGLQAPIVFLPDTMLDKPPQRPRLIWPDKTGLPVPLWTPRKADEPNAYAEAMRRVEFAEEQEYRRLLYVALTRAEDRLIICGHGKGKPAKPESWYGMAQQGFTGLEPVETLVTDPATPDAVTLRFGNPQSVAPKPDKEHRAALPPVDMKDPAFSWVVTPPAAEPFPPRPLMPSRPSESEPPAQSPLSPDDRSRFRRGLVTHRLLQTLPELPQARWADAARMFVETQAQDLSAPVRASIVEEVMNILLDADLSPLFGPLSQAEVPITGHVGNRLVSGQLDRILVMPDAIWIVDYKSNRPPPTRAEDVPAIYRRQLAAYADTLAAIYPGRAIRTFLLWTDGPRLMEIETAHPPA